MAAVLILCVVGLVFAWGLDVGFDDMANRVCQALAYDAAIEIDDDYYCKRGNEARLMWDLLGDGDG